MISLIKRDILKNTKYKYIFYIIIVYFIYLLFQRIVFPNSFSDIMRVFSRNLGICYDTAHFLDILIILLTNFLYSYNALSILISDLRCGKEQILLRTSKERYIITKIFSIAIVTFLINIAIYLLLSFSLFLMGYSIYNFELLKLLIIDLIIKVLFQYIIITVYTLFKNNISNLCSFVTPIIALLNIDVGKNLFAYSHNNINGYWIIILIIVVIISYLILKLKISSLFEREEKNEI